MRLQICTLQLMAIHVCGLVYSKCRRPANTRMPSDYAGARELAHTAAVGVFKELLLQIPLAAGLPSKMQLLSLGRRLAEDADLCR